MSDDIIIVENSIEEILIDLMAKKLMSVGMKASSTQGLEASPWVAQRCSSRPAADKCSKNCDDLVNAKLTPYILLKYILPLASAVSHDSVLRDLDYTLITAYLPKGIHGVGL